MSASPLSFTVVHEKLTFNQNKLHAHLLTICSSEDYTIQDLSVVFTSHKTVRELNVKYLQHDYDTDVLSFSFNPNDESRTIDGEIYVNLDMAMERREEFGVTFEEEVYRYAIHGLLHLMDYDDKTPNERRIMKERESHYLNMLTNS